MIQGYGEATTVVTHGWKGMMTHQGGGIVKGLQPLRDHRNNSLSPPPLPDFSFIFMRRWIRIV